MKMDTGNQGQRTRDNFVPLLIGATSGVILGGIVAILLAPRPGRETRALLQARASSAREHIMGDALREVEAQKVTYRDEHGHAPG